MGLSPGQHREIDFAFALALIKILNTMKRRPLNLLIIDSLNFLTNTDIRFLLEGLTKLPDFSILVFDVGPPPDFLPEDLYEVKHIRRNPRLRKSDALEDMEPQRTLDEFFT
ncbi:MAG: hypothetical protein ACE5I5_12625 [Candidatus Heimdallarchaeota archaeon]